MTVFHETSHGHYDTGGHPDDLLFIFAQSLIKTWTSVGEFVKRHVLHDYEAMHGNAFLKVPHFCAVKIVRTA